LSFLRHERDPLALTAPQHLDFNLVANALAG
jgi:hypothetical protein